MGIIGLNIFFFFWGYLGGTVMTFFGGVVLVYRCILDVPIGDTEFARCGEELGWLPLGLCILAGMVYLTKRKWFSGR